MKKSLIYRFFSNLGPGLIAGAADDDPSGIATYSAAGAAMGTQLLWLALFTWPLMAAVQMTCAHIGMVTGRGLAGAFHHKFPKSFIIVTSVMLLVANTINIGADLSGMAAAGEMLTGIGSSVLVAIFGVVITLATVFFRYRQIAGILKWLALALLGYVATVFILQPKWWPILRASMIPSWPTDRRAWSVVVAILGTTISPYLFYWQASQEIEEAKAAGRRILARCSARTKAEFGAREIDVGVGTFFSNLVMYFIILSTALTLNQHGQTEIDTAEQAAAALRPFAGNVAGLLFTLGIVGVGFLAIPTLSGSAAYALAETFGWHQGLDARYKAARGFYLVIIFSTLAGVAMNCAGVNPVRALLWTAVINGAVAPFLLLGVFLVALDGKKMRRQPSSQLALAGVAFAILIMFGALAGLIFV